MRTSDFRTPDLHISCALSVGQSARLVPLHASACLSSYPCAPRALLLLLLQIPGVIVSACSKVLGPLLCDQQSTSIILVSSNPAQGGPAGAGGLYGPAAGGGGINRPPAGRAAAAAAGGTGGGGRAVEPSPGAVSTLVAMGFSRQQAVAALQQAGNDVQAAIALLVGGH